MPRPFAESCVQNGEPILRELRRLLAGARQVLEIGSGTGQHAVHFAGAMPHLVWQPTDLPGSHAGIEAWRRDAGLPNVRPPLTLDARRGPWPDGPWDAVFAANVVHIMPWGAVEGLFTGAAQVLAGGGRLILYGPFHYGGRPTAPGNARFDAWLRQRDPRSGVRDFEDLDALARTGGLELEEDIAMPVHNRTLVWIRPH